MQNLRLALRALTRAPAVSLAALLSLAIGIGANTTIFSLVNAVFLQGTGVEEPERVVTVFVSGEDPRLANAIRMSHPNFEDLARRSRSFSQLTEIAPAPATLTVAGGEPERVAGQMATSSFFPLLGVEPALGRFFLAEEDAALGSAPVVVLAWGFWQKRFGGDPAALGRALTLNGQPFTVIGIAPPGFRGTLLLIDPAYWVPLSMVDTFLPGDQRRWFQDRRALLGRAYGRLGPEVGLDQARAELAALGKTLAEEHPIENKGRTFDLLPLAQAAVEPDQRKSFVTAGALLMGAVALVLLVAVGNVANLLLARAQARRREIGVRLALGASRGQLIRQLLTESLMLSLAAGALGLALAHGGQKALWALRPPALANAPIAPATDLTVLAFTLGVSLAAGLLFGLAPALQASRPELVADLKQPSDAASGATRVLSLKNLLVVAQVALCLVALTLSGLFLRSLARATRAEVGLDADRLAALRIDLSQQGLPAPAGEQLFDQVLARARILPGVEAATLAAHTPLGEGGSARTVVIAGRAPEAANNRVMVQMDTVEPGYLRTVGLALVSGRDLADLDRRNTTPVALINQAMAELFWPGDEALGQRFQIAGDEREREVVGVVANAKHSEVTEAPQPQAFLPRRQLYQPSLALLVRSGGEPAALLPGLRAEVRRIDPTVPVPRADTIAQRVRESLWAPRTAASLLGLLGLLALLLAAVGIYGVTSYSVGQRARELGIRSALGAARRDVLGLVLGHGMKVAALGLLLGLALSYFAARFVASLLFGVGALDPLTWLATPLVLAGVALLANLVPADRATRIDPIKVLSFER